MAPRLSPELAARAQVLDARCAQLRAEVHEKEVAWERDGGSGQVGEVCVWWWGCVRA